MKNKNTRKDELEKKAPYIFIARSGNCFSCNLWITQLRNKDWPRAAHLQEFCYAIVR
jgi:hypothetical protein